MVCGHCWHANIWCFTRLRLVGKDNKAGIGLVRSESGQTVKEDEIWTPRVQQMQGCVQIALGCIQIAVGIIGKITIEHRQGDV